MNGAITDPWEATKTTANATRIMAKGKSQIFLLTYAYLTIWLKILRNFEKFFI